MSETPPVELPRRTLGRTALRVPPIVFGTSCLGNLYQTLPWDEKLAIVRAWFEHVPRPVVIDTAGKYGAGLALQCIGRALRELRIGPGDILISNKLGWLRVPLEADEPTFEPGVWAGLEHDATQDLSAAGIEDCWRQGNDLLGAPYTARVLSVHDPDEYLAAAIDDADRQRRIDEIVAAYDRLHELKRRGEADAVGVGAKDWRVIAELADRVALDWVMLANSYTAYRHPPELGRFVQRLRERGVGLINSAVFHAGFLVGGDFLDYEKFDAARHDHAEAKAWRERFFTACDKHGVAPAHACIRFGLVAPQADAVALNTSTARRIPQNVQMVRDPPPVAFWRSLADAGLIESETFRGMIATTEQ
ncbi:MAG: aldo/keto reductase [Planctomycetota bacterium]